MVMPLKEQWLFLKRWVKSPLRVGSIVPSSAYLAEKMAQRAFDSAEACIVEIGAGTGSFTKALLDKGINPQNLWVVEIDASLCHFLKKRFPEINIVCGDASKLEQILPSAIVGNVSAVVSGIPMINLSKETQRLIVNSCFRVLKSGGQLLQFTYDPLQSPIDSQYLNLACKRVGRVLRNFPPATIWQYHKKSKDFH